MGKRVVVFGWASQVQVHLPRWVYGLSDRGFEIKVVALGGTPLEGIETANLPRGGKFSYFTQARRAVDEALKFRPDIVHAHYATGFGYWAYRTGIKPAIVSMYGSEITDFPKRWLNRALVRKVLREATHLTSSSRFLADLAERLEPGSAAKTTVIPFGVRVPDEFSPVPKSGDIRVCYIKHHNWWYGPDVLLDAMVLVKKANPRISLTIAGTGEMEAQLKEQAERLQLGDTVKFTGYIESEDMYEHIANHHFMVMPSRREAFGVAALETGACGRAVLATRVGGVPEVVVDGKTGRLIESGDHEVLARGILEMADDYDSLKTMGAAGHEFVRENYSWEKSLDMMQELYERALYESK